MTEHDPLCKQRFDPYQPPCPECEILATGRADERKKVHVTSTGLSGRIDYAQVRSEMLADLRAKAGKLPRRYRKEHGKWLITVDVADLASLLGGSDD